MKFSNQSANDKSNTINIVWMAEYQANNGCYLRRIVNKNDYPDFIDKIEIESKFFGLIKKKSVIRYYFFRLLSHIMDENGKLIPFYPWI